MYPRNTAPPVRRRTDVFDVNLRSLPASAIVAWFLLAVVIPAGNVAAAQDSLQLSVRTIVDGRLENATRGFLVDTLRLRVPENRSDVGDGVIELPVVRIHATSVDAAEPVFWLGGGPGQTNFRTFDYDYFIDRHDHVMVGYRGVDGSSSLDCPEVSQVLREVDDVLEDRAIDSLQRGFARCWDRLTAAGVDVDGYTLIEVVRDIEEAREALGYDRIDIVAESFGTRIAYLYALVYPENVDRTILVGAQPPGGMVWDPQQADSIVAEFGRLWSKDSHAAARYPDLVEAMRSVYGDMPRTWLLMPIHPGNVKASAHAMFFDRGTVPKVLDAYVAAANGDPSGLWLMSVVAPFIFPEVVNWGDNASKAVSADHRPGRDYYHELLPVDAIFGAPLGAFLWAPAAAWPIEPMENALRVADTSFVPTLIVSGNLDLSTPAENVKTGLLPYLPNGAHVVFREMTHIGDLWSLNPDGMRRLTTTFLETGVVDTSAVKYVPMDFDVNWGFPTLAKLIVVGVVLGSALLILMIVFIFRRIRVRFKN